MTATPEIRCKTAGFANSKEPRWGEMPGATDSRRNYVTLPEHSRLDKCPTDLLLPTSVLGSARFVKLLFRTSALQPGTQKNDERFGGPVVRVVPGHHPSYFFRPPLFADFVGSCFMLRRCCCCSSSQSS